MWIRTGCCLSAHRPSSHKAVQCPGSVQTVVSLGPASELRRQNASDVDSLQSTAQHALTNSSPHPFFLTAATHSLAMVVLVSVTDYFQKDLSQTCRKCDRSMWTRGDRSSRSPSCLRYFLSKTRFEQV